MRSGARRQKREEGDNFSAQRRSITFFFKSPRPESFSNIFQRIILSQSYQLRRRLLEQLLSIEESVENIPLVGGNQEDVGGNWDEDEIAQRKADLFLKELYLEKVTRYCSS